MIRIGDFARLSQVSVVTLRHYDEIGLLKPVEIDRFTGYRYYAVTQLQRLNRILALKDLGFSLQQIEQVLSGGLTLDELRGMLKLKHAEVEQQVAEEQARLARIAARLRQIELENSMPDYDVILKTVSPIRVVSQRITIPTNDQASDYLDNAFGAICRHMVDHGAKANGPSLALWHQGADVLENEVAEAAMPIDRDIDSSDSVTVYALPQVEVASTVHKGTFENFNLAHAALLEWIEANHYRVVGPYREIYINHSVDNVDASVTEIQYPVEKT